MQVCDYPVKAPSVCFLCEGVPPETPFVDTLRDWNAGVVTSLNGRKYVCETCVSDAAAALGLFDERSAPLQAQCDELAEKVAQLEADNENYKTVQAAIEQLGARPVVQVEETVNAAVSAAQARKDARKAAAKAAQDAKKAEDVAAAEGAAKQAEIDQAAADAAQAASEAAFNAPVEEPTPEVPADPPVDGTPAEAGNAPA